MSEYDFQRIEQDAQQAWRDQNSFRVQEHAEAPRFYCLSMLPYPSGQLHVGHIRNYAIGDAIARYQRMRGKQVLQPMGWDAFGMPAENAAIANNMAPADWTHKNIANMRRQLQRFGFAYDWERELNTSDPSYYRWEQWFFTHLIERGLAYKKCAPVNWCPVDATVLANEQVIDGCCWRCGTQVEHREVSQWFLKITDYAEELLSGLDTVSWPAQVKTMQRNWIGRSEGVEVVFEVPDHAAISVYTTRPDTLFGATYLAVSVDHPLVQQSLVQDDAIREFTEACKQTAVSEELLEKMEKRGIALGIDAINPINGEAIPIWAANFVLSGYGTGAVMCVPAHDERDWHFAKKYHLPIRQVVRPKDDTEICIDQQAYVEKNGIVCQSGELDGLEFQAAFDRVAALLQARGLGQRKVNYRLRDWGVSRQRYWGAPIPVIYCDHCGTVPVPASDLPVVLPEDVALHQGESPLKHLQSFRYVPCPTCGADAERETDTFDTFMESSWYFLRYTCPDQDASMLDERANYWAPVDQYIGGIEHAVLHLLYARFYHKLLRDAGLVQCDEPFANLLTQGMVLKDGKKMSKSKGNTVDPEYIVERYGADTARLFLLFAAPPRDSIEWSDTGVEGAFRFIKRCVRLVAQYVEAGLGDLQLLAQAQTEPQRALRRKTHQTIDKVSDDLGRRYTFNTAIAAVMELMNQVSRFEDQSDIGRAVAREALESAVLLLSPMVPHIAHKLWGDLGHGQSIIDAPWPVLDPAALLQDRLELIVQINGKLRARMMVDADTDAKVCEQAALTHEKITQHLMGQTVRRVVVVPGKLVNIVV